jgi:hypothetical protein
MVDFVWIINLLNVFTGAQKTGDFGGKKRRMAKDVRYLSVALVDVAMRRVVFHWTPPQLHGVWRLSKVQRDL